MHVNSNSILQAGCLPFLLPAVGFSSPYVSNLVNTQGVEWEFCSIPSENITNKPTSLIQQCINLISQIHHFVTEMCTILFQNGALCDIGLRHCGIFVKDMWRKLYSSHITWVSWRLKSPATVYSTACSDPHQRKHQSSSWLALWVGIMCDHWIPLTNSQ